MIWEDALTAILAWTLIGTLAGILVGAIPGLTGAMAIALTIPLTLGMDRLPALALLVAMYVGSVSGGLITATLLKMPGTPAAIMTTLDAYPMAARGEPRRALLIGILASLVGGLFSWVVLVSISKPLAAISMKLSPFDYLSMVIVALVLITTISKGDLPRGLLVMFLGILIALPGINIATGQQRLTFGIPQLGDGLKQLPVLIGLFAVTESLRLLSRNSGEVEELSADGGKGLTLKEWGQQAVNLVRSSSIGSFIGVLPGIGANIGSLLAYGAAKTSAKDRDQFGSGADSAVVASESANNATVGGALVPLISLGIPGSVIDAILLGAFMIHGLQPGPLLFKNSPDVVSVITWSYLAANLFMVAIMYFGLKLMSKLIHVPKHLLVPSVLTFGVVGCYALRNQMFDVWVMLIFGLLGLLLLRLRIPLAPLVLGFILAPIAEENLVRGLMSTGGHAWPMITSPVSLIFLIISLALLVSPYVPWRKWLGQDP